MPCAPPHTLTHRYWVKGMFDHCGFFYDNRKSLPVHYRVFMGDVFNKKFASASVETLFSGAGRLMARCAPPHPPATTSLPHILAAPPCRTSSHPCSFAR